MHMSDALISSPVAIGAGVVAARLIATAAIKVRKSNSNNYLPLIGVLGAFVFAAQMINIAIPATGASGHIIGGVFLSAIIGPWAAFLTLSAVIIIQAVVFADGGILALGCNIINMAATSCLFAYPLIFRPIVRFPASFSRIMTGSIFTCVVALECGALLVTAETSLSGVSVLSSVQFLLLMTSIHLVIGVGEGLATGGLLAFIQKHKPALLIHTEKPTSQSLRRSVMAFAVASLVVGGVLAYFASSNPDGLEWSVANAATKVNAPAESILPIGIIIPLLTIVIIWGVFLIVNRVYRYKHSVSTNE